jgi:hypothetical protein
MDSYADLMRRLADAYGAAQARRADVLAWYDRQRTAAGRALADAEEAAAEEAAAQTEVGYVAAEVEGLWRRLVEQVPPAARYGGPPTPDPQAPGDADPADLLRQAASRLRQARDRQPVSGAAYLVFFVFGGIGAALAAAAAYGLRVGARSGGDWAVALPVIALIVTLLGVVAGLVPTRLFADRRGLALDAVAVIVTVFGGVVATVLLWPVVR